MINNQLIIPKINREEGPVTTSNVLLHLDAKDPASYPGTGSTWFDLSGRNKHGTTNGAIHDDYAFQFDGVNDFIKIGNLGATMNQYTIQLWFKMDTYSYGWPNIIDVNNETYHHNTGPRLHVETNGRLSWVISGHTSVSTLDYITTSTGSFGTWHSTALVLSSANYSTYFNGQPTNVNVPNSSGILGSFEDINLGRGFFANGNYRYFKGEISKVVIYSVPLSNQQILDNYNAVKPRFL